MAEGDATLLPAGGRVPRRITHRANILFSYYPSTPHPPFWIRFGHGCPYVRAAPPWMAVHMASLAFSWARNLGRNDEGKTLCPDCAGAQYPIKKQK